MAVIWRASATTVKASERRSQHHRMSDRNGDTRSQLGLGPRTPMQHRQPGPVHKTLSVFPHRSGRRPKGEVLNSTQLNSRRGNTMNRQFSLTRPTFSSAIRPARGLLAAVALTGGVLGAGLAVAPVASAASNEAYVATEGAGNSLTTTTRHRAVPGPSARLPAPTRPTPHRRSRSARRVSWTSSPRAPATR